MGLAALVAGLALDRWSQDLIGGATSEPRSEYAGWASVRFEL